MGNPLGIGPKWPGNYVQPNTANPVPNPAIVVGAPPPPNAIGPQAAFTQPGTTPATSPAPNPSVTVQPLSVEANLVRGPLPPPIYTQPADVYQTVTPAPPASVMKTTANPPYIAPSDPPPSVATVAPNNISGNPLKVEGPQAPYQQPGTDAPQGVQGIVAPLRQDSGVVLLENAP
jgi:hypothetical protein